MKKLIILMLIILASSMLFADPDWYFAQSAGGSSDDTGNSIALDGSGNSYIIGSFYGTATFGPYSLTSSGSADIFVAKLDSNGNYLWAKRAGGYYHDYGNSIALDESGNSYITGSFWGTATFGSYSLTSSGSADIFVAKLDSNGNYLWAKKAGGSSHDYGNSIALDESGNSYITGFFYGTASFGSHSLTSSGYSDIFVAKLDSNGNYLWAKKAGGSSHDEGNSIALDESGNYYITGNFEGTATFGSHSLISSGNRDIFVAKLDSTGNYLWAKRAGGLSYDYGKSIALDESGNSYITGSFGGTASFGSYSLTSSGSYVAKLDSNGNYLWAKKAGGSFGDYGKSIALDENGNSYITGNFYGTVTFGSYSLSSSGSSDIFVAKLDSNGNYLWAKKAGGSSYDYGSSIALDESGNSYITGSFSGTATFGSYSLSSSGDYDIFVARLGLIDFTVDKTEGYNPLTVNFTDLSTINPTSWQWDFDNDGTIDSNEQNPTYQYTTPGTYSVSLTVSNGTFTHTILKEDLITIVEPNNEFHLVAPSSFSTDIDVYPRLEWESLGLREPFHYSVYLSTSPAFSAETTTVYETQNTYLYPPRDLTVGTTYFWKVIAYFEDGSQLEANMNGQSYWMLTTVQQISQTFPMLDGLIAEDRTLIAENSPYWCNNNPHNEVGKNLTIEAGVTLKFNSGVNLELNGNLYCEGTVIDSVIFTGYTSQTSWAGIHFGDNDYEDLVVDETNYISGNHLNHTLIENVVNNIALDNIYTNIYIENSNFENVKKAIVCGNNSYLMNNNFFGINSSSAGKGISGGGYFLNNTISQFDDAVNCAYGAIFINNTVINNLGYGVNGGNQFTDCTISDNSDYGVNCNQDAVLANCTISDNSDYAINGGSIFQNNIINNNGGENTISSSSPNFVFENNELNGNQSTYGLFSISSYSLLFSNNNLSSNSNSSYSSYLFNFNITDYAEFTGNSFQQNFSYRSLISVTADSLLFSGNTLSSNNQNNDYFGNINLNIGNLATIDSNTIIENTGFNNLFELLGTNYQITNNTITNNTSQYNGSDISVLHCSADSAYINQNTISHNTLTGNSSYETASIICNSGIVNIDKNTITYNSANYDCSAIFVKPNSQTYINNNLITNNSGPYAVEGVPIEFEYNNLYGNANSDNEPRNLKHTTSANVSYIHNFWGTRSDQGIIDPTIYDDNEDSSIGMVTYQPIYTAPSPETPGQLSIVDSVMATYSIDSEEANSSGVTLGSNIYLCLLGNDGNPYSQDITEMNVTNITTGYPLQPLLWETGENTGIYRNTITLSATTYNPQQNILMANIGDTIKLQSIVDPSKVFYVEVVENGINIPDEFSFDEDTVLDLDFNNYINLTPDQNYSLSVTGNNNISVNIDSFAVQMSAPANWNGSETMIFNLVEASRIVLVDTVNVVVNSINDAPTITNPIADFSFDEDTVNSSIDLNNVFDDADLDYGDVLTYSFSGNTNIGVEISEGDVSLTPNQDWNGSETITFTATDNAGESVSDDVVITVNNVNDAPVINLPESFTFDEDGSLNEDFSSYISDIDSENLTLSVSGNTNIQVAIDGENVTFSAPQNWSGSETLTFTVDDLYNDDSRRLTNLRRSTNLRQSTNRATAFAQIQIIVNPVNDAPFLINAIADFSFDEDTIDSSINLNNVFDDVDLAYGDALTYSFSGNTNIGVEILEGVVTLTPNTNWNGIETITFTATDNAGESVSDEVVITVNPINDAPVINLPESFTFDEDGSLSEDFSSYISDIDSENLTLSVSGNTNIQVAIDGENVTFSALENWNGNETLTFTVSDNRNRAIGTDDIQIIVNPVNDAPFLINGIADFSFDEDTIDSSINLNNVFDDADLAYGDALTYSFSGNTNIGVEISEGVVTLTPNANWNGSETITFTATDNAGESISDEVVITVNPVNDAPVINLPESFTFDEDGSLSEDFSAYISDIDSENLTLSVSGNTNIQVAIDGENVTFSALENWNGNETLTFTVDDLYNDDARRSNASRRSTNLYNDDFRRLTNLHRSTNRATASAQIQIIVNPVNDAPFVSNPIADFSFDEDTVNSSIDLNDVFDDVDLAYGDALTYSFGGNTNIGVEISEGVVTLTPNENWNGSETITFTATDNAGESVSDEVVITINPVNDAPVINLPESFTFDEDGSLSEDFSAYISDIDSENLTLSVSGNTNIQVAIDGENVTFSALENWSGSETLTFTVDDLYNDDSRRLNDSRRSNGLRRSTNLRRLNDLRRLTNRATASAQIQIIVNPVNDAPFLINGIADFSFDEDTIDSSINLNNIFDDADLAYGDALTYSFSGNTNIGVEISEGVVTLTPNANWNGSETITFTATDNAGESVSDEVVITINNVNDAPVINLPESFTFDEDGSLIEDFSSYISDIDSENLTLSVSGNTNIQVAIDGENVTFSAPQNWSGSETITFTVSDNRNRAIGTDDIQIIVNPVNDAPFLINGMADFSFDEDTIDSSINLNNVFDDADLAYGDALTYSFSGNTNIAVEISEGVVTLTPNANWNGSETITFTATDNAGESVSDEVVITINNVNDAPVINLPESFTFDEDGSLSEDFSSYISDIDSENLTLSVSGNTNIQVAIDGENVTFSALENWNGNETITFTVSDNRNRAIGTDDIQIIVNPVNDAPFLINGIADFSFDEDTIDSSINLNTVFDDVDLAYGDALTYSFSGNTNIGVEISEGVVTLTPNENWNGSETITFTATDNAGESVSDEVVITVNPVNDAPVINLPESFTFDEDGSLSEDFSSYISDIDSENLTLSVSGNTNIQVAIDGENVTFSAPQNWSGSETLTFTVDDLYNDDARRSTNLYNDDFRRLTNLHRSTNRATASAQIQIIVNPIEDAPFVSNPIADFFFDEDTIDSSINLNNVFDDVDLAYGDALTYSFSGNTNIGVEISEGVVTLTPNQDWSGSETITFTATDNAGESVSDEVVLTVNPVNDAPVINLPESFTFDEDGSLSEDFSSYISDIDTENLTLSVSGNTNIQVAIDGENVTFSAPQNWSGSETLTFTVSDNRNRAIGTDDIQIIVNPVNDAPFLINGIADFSFDEDTVNSSIDLNNVFDDADLPYGDALTYSFSGNTNIGVEISEGVVTLTPNANWNGSETITFTATDNAGESVSDEVVITVNPVNDAPVITSFTPEETSINLTEISSIDFEVIAEDVDSELSYAWTINTENQEITSNALTYEFNENGTYNINCIVSDGEFQVEQNWTVTLEIVNADDGYLIPKITELVGNYPNPFNPTTTIKYNLSKSGFVKIDIFNVLGQKITTLVNSPQKEGRRTVLWTGKNNQNQKVSSGIYFYRMSVDNTTYTMKKCILLK